MIKKILVANRGEIAVRIIKTAKKLGISTVSLFTNDEKDALWTQIANEAILLGEGNMLETYLDPIRIINIAKKAKCDAIHPGYGFLSENWQFAQLCEQENITFIGPSFKHIKLMGDKIKAREFVQKIGIPVPEGITGSTNFILSKKSTLKYPVIIKAVGGGGGKGMHIVRQEKDLSKKLQLAANEAFKWFGNDQVFVEQYFEDARHIEVQVLSDSYGNAIHLYERECSLQRNYQKVIEEAPSPTLSNEHREQICNAAITIVKQTGYTNIGTVEFLWQNGMFYFLEMNTRIQVEHPVTESITGIDIIEQQIHVANNFELNLRQKDIKINGHAVEGRIYAENPTQNFKPSAGYMHFYNEPQNAVRIDSGYSTAKEITPNYDGLISKVIAHKSDRYLAIKTLQNTLNSYSIHGVDQNIEYLSCIINSDDFITNKFNTGYLNSHAESLLKKLHLRRKQIDSSFIIAGYLSFKYSCVLTNNPLWSLQQSYADVGYDQLTIDNRNVQFKYKKTGNRFWIQLEDQEFEVDYKNQINNRIEVVINNDIAKTLIVTEGTDKYWIEYDSTIFKVASQNNINQAIINKKASSNPTTSVKQLKSPLHGSISDIFMEVGKKVKQGDVLLTIESMKTENQIVCPGNGVIKEIMIRKSDQVIENQLLIQFE